MLFDSHLHFDQLTEIQQKEIMADPRIVGILAVSTNLHSAQQLLQLKKQFSEKYHIAAGFHPEQALPNLAQQNSLFKWIEANQMSITAIGEVGLPHYLKRENPNLDYQPYINLLERFVILAKKLDLPLNLHIVHDDVTIALNLLNKHQISRAHFHWFKTDPKSFQQFLATPYLASVTPDILWNPKTQYVAKNLPLERLMIETDSPWPHQGLEQASHSAQLQAIVEKIADLKSLDPNRVAQQLMQNTQQFYRL